MTWPGNSRETGSTFLNDMRDGIDYAIVYGIPILLLIAFTWFVIWVIRNRHK